MPMMCEECKCSNWYCPNCKDTTHNDCDCLCCGCACQRQDSTALAVHKDNQPDPKGNTMTTDTPFGATVTDYVAPDVQIAKLQERNDFLEGRYKAYGDSLVKYRNQVSDMYVRLNDHIKDEELDEESDINIWHINEMLKDVWGNELIFTKEFEVQIEVSGTATFKITAKDEDEAREIAGDIEVQPSEFHLDYNNTELTECLLEMINICYVGKE